MRMTYKLIVKTVLTLTILAFSLPGFAASVTDDLQMQETADRTVNRDTMPPVQKSLPVSIKCQSYEDCLAQYDLFTAEQQNEVVLIYYSNANRDFRYNIYDDILLRVGSNSCPPVLNFYQKVNNVNYLLDIFEKTNNSECFGYYVNVKGTGSNRNTIIGQLEVNFCKESSLENQCENAMMLVKKNNFKDQPKEEDYNVRK